MVLQSSGAISFDDIQTEFDGENPISIDEYYGVASGIPTSGLISLYEFYGKSSELLSDADKARLNAYLSSYLRKLDTVVYSASTHGWSNATFHSMCDSLPGSVLVCKTTNGYVFGAYIGDQNWSGSGYKISRDAFTFNLIGAVGKYDVTNISYAIYAATGQGPVFGNGHDIYTQLDTQYNYTYKGGYGGGGGPHGYLNGITSGNGPHLADVEVWKFASNTVMTTAEQAQLETYLATRSCKLGTIQYKATLHGWSNAIFHTLCDSLSGSVAVCKTNNGYVFGGYIGDQNWSGSSVWKTSNDAFTFNIQGNIAKYDVTTPSNAIYVRTDYGPTFGGGHDMHTNLDNRHHYGNKNGYGGGGGPSSYLSATSGNDVLTEVEVWSRETISFMTDTQKAQLNTYLSSYGTTLGEIKYKATLHGWSNTTFHSKCDLLEGSVVVCKANNGYVFGGYIGDQTWAPISNYKNSSDAFTFNLYGAVAKYDVGPYPQYAIYTSTGYGPAFGGGHDMYTVLDSKYVSSNKHSYGGGGGGAYLSATSGNVLTNVEVWCIL